MGGIITGSAFTKQFPTINTTTGHGNATLQGFVVAIYNIGCWAGALLTVFIGEALGRKRTIIVGATILARGTVIQCSSYELVQLMAGKHPPECEENRLASHAIYRSDELSPAQETASLPRRSLSGMLSWCRTNREGGLSRRRFRLMW